MGNTLDSDIYPTVTFVDPLIMPLYIKTNSFDSIRAQVNGDWLLKAYIKKLDKSIIDDIPELKEKAEIIQDIMDYTRAYGWCVFQSYKEYDKVFAPYHRTDWIRETDEATQEVKKVGVEVHWVDEVQNARTDQLYFEDRENTNKQIVGKAYLITWEHGDGQPIPHCPIDTQFALPDLDLSILSLAIQIRQIQSSLTFGATNPYFYHLKYGDAITPTQRTNLISQLGLVNTSKGLGAKTSILEEIISVENGGVDKCILALDTLISFFAGVTMLPLSFYMGEKQIGSGLDSGGAESNDKQDLIDRKEVILKHFTPYLEEINTNEWKLQIGDLDTLYEAKREEMQKQKNDQMQKEADMKGGNNVDNKQ